MRTLKHIKSFNEATDTTGDNNIINNILSAYDTFKEIEDYPSILKPMDPFITNVGLHWDSHKFSAISKYLDDIEDFIDKKITEEELLNIFKEGKYINKNDLNFFHKRAKTKEEIDNLFDKGKKSTTSKEEILNLIENSNLTEDDIQEIYSVLSDIRFDRHKQK